MKPSLVLINPWIHDFAAYDLWSKPLGLLYLAAYLREEGCQVHLIDCLDVHHPEMARNASLRPPRRGPFGTGKFWREPIAKPPPLKHVARSYSRYGLLPEIFERELGRIDAPSAILVTSLMTYWYPGVMEAIRLARKVHPEVPVILGGIYARLCHDHAVVYSGADRVIADPGIECLVACLEEYDIRLTPATRDDQYFAYPAFDLLRKIDYICIMTSTGCPFRCQYCASHFLYPAFSRREPGEVTEEIVYWHTQFGVRDVAFYDDAFLMGSETHAAIILEGLARRDITLRFHTPNALHVGEITNDIAGLMLRTGFETIRLGLETADMGRDRPFDDKVRSGDFERAMHYLKKAGFSPRHIGAYILMGLPEQNADSIVDTIGFAEAHGAFPYLAEYSPVPHTVLWQQAVSCSAYDLEAEPLFHNNTLLPCWDDDRKRVLPRLRQRVSESRQRLRQP